LKKTPTALPRYDIDINAVADMLAMSHQTIRDWVHDGIFPRPLAIGRKWRWNREELLAWIEARKGAPVMSGSSDE
jgi:excisionase family DNA binding protein